MVKLLRFKTSLSCETHPVETWMEQGFKPKGGTKHEPKKFQVTWSIKKKNMIDKTISLYYHKYLSQEGNNMNQKS